MVEHERGPRSSIGLSNNRLFKRTICGRVGSKRMSCLGSSNKFEADGSRIVLEQHERRHLVHLYHQQKNREAEEAEEEKFAFIMYPNAETTDEPQVLKRFTFFGNRRFEVFGQKTRLHTASSGTSQSTICRLQRAMYQTAQKLGFEGTEKLQNEARLKLTKSTYLQ